MRKHWPLSVFVVAASGLALAALLHFGRTPAEPTSAPSTQPTEDAQERLAERDRLLSEAATREAEGKYAEALALHGKALDIERGVLGEHHEQVAATLRKRAELYALGDDFENARKEAREALDLQSGLPDTQPWQITEARWSLNRVEERSKMGPAQRHKLLESDRLSRQMLDLYVKGRHREGVQLAEQVRDIAEQTLPDRHPDLGTCLNNLAVFHHALGDYGRAEPLYRKALDIFKAALGEEHPDSATTLTNLGVLLGLKGDYKKALPLYTRALALRKQVLGDKHPDYVRCVNNLAWLYKAMGDYAKAEPLYLEAVRLHEQGLRYGRPNGRILEIFRQVDLRRPPTVAEVQTDLALIVGNLAVCYHEMGDYARAEPLYRKALHINKETQGERSATYARNLNNLASLYQLMGDYFRAEELFKKAVALRKEALGEKHPDYATSLHNLARLYHLIEDYDRAEPLYLQALAIRKEKLGEKHPYYAQTLDKLAWLYHARGDYARAEPLYATAMEVRKLSLGDKHRYDATILTNQALLYHALGDLDRAEALFRKSLEWTKQQVGEHNPEYARTQHHLAMLQLGRKKYADAERLARPPVSFSHTLRERCAGVQSERQQLAMIHTSRFFLDGYLTVVAEGGTSPKLAYAEVLAWKGAVLARQRRLRLQRRHPELAADFAQLERVTGRLATLALAVPDPRQQTAYRRQIQDLSEEKERLESDLSRVSAAFRQERQAERLTPDRLQAALPPGTALVDFLEYNHRSPSEKKKGQWHFERHLAAFVVRRDSIEQLDLGPLQPITAAIDRWRGNTKRTRPVMDEKDSAVELRRLLWQPLERHLKGARLVLISPDGALARLPLGALPGSEPDKYLLEEVPLAVVPVPQLLPELLAADKADAKAEPSLLLVGDVDFGASSGVADARGASRAAQRGSRSGALLRFGGLEATREEMLAVADSFRRGHRSHKVLLNELREEEATEVAVRRLAPKHRYLHFATHGFFAPPELRSALAPAPARQKGPDMVDLLGRQGVSGFHPGLLSGLALAGANRPGSTDGDDGILTALEVAEMDLSGVQMATLSACETGLGESAGGEGLLGLQRAFQVAGARSVVASLWKVDDEATRKLMARFYENLWRSKDPLSKMEALRQAQLWMLREGIKRGLAPLPDEEVRAKEARTPPYYWAAFVLSGDWR